MYYASYTARLEGGMFPPTPKSERTTESITLSGIAERSMSPINETQEMYGAKIKAITMVSRITKAMRVAG